MIDTRAFASAPEGRVRFHGLAVFALLFAVTVAVRLPFINIVHDDEAFFAVISQRWLQGEWPYAASFDVKPPLIFVVLALAQAVFGMHIWVVKLVEILAVALGALGIFELTARCRPGHAGLWASLLYIGFSLPMMGVYFPVQSIQMALTVWAMVEAVKAQKTENRVSLCLSGAYIGLAVLSKQTAAFEALALMIWLGLSAKPGQIFKTLFVWCLSAAVPILLCVATFAVAGHGQALIRDAGFLAMARAGFGHGTVATIGPFGIVTRLITFCLAVTPLAPLLIGGALFVRGRPRLLQESDPKLTWLLPLWLGLIVLGMFSCVFIDVWYAVPLIAPGVIMTGLVIENVLPRPNWRSAGFQLLLVVAIIAATLAANQQTLIIKGARNAPDIQAAQHAALKLRALGMKRGDSLLIPIRGYSIYFFTGNMPQTPYFSAGHLVCDSPTPSQDPLGEALDSRPKYIVMPDARLKLGCALDSHVARISGRLATDYDLISDVGGTWDHFYIYKRHS